VNPETWFVSVLMSWVVRRSWLLDCEGVVEGNSGGGDSRCAVGIATDSRGNIPPSVSKDANVVICPPQCLERSQRVLMARCLLMYGSLRRIRLEPRS
jgi:hypothetical protein